MMVGEAQNNNQDAGLNYTNLPPMGTLERIQTTMRTSARPTGAIKKIPENLKLRSDDKINNNNTEENSSYRASGPYIPLSDCFSGSPVLLFVSLVLANAPFVSVYKCSNDSIFRKTKMIRRRL